MLRDGLQVGVNTKVFKTVNSICNFASTVSRRLSQMTVTAKPSQGGFNATSQGRKNALFSHRKRENKENSSVFMEEAF